MQQSVETNPINEPGSVVNFKDGVFVRDMLMTLFAAILTGISGSLLFILLVFGWGSAQAESREQSGVQLQLRSLDGQLLQQAPLLKTDVQIDVTGMLALVRVEHLFTNPGRVWMEGTYQFPLPEKSAVERLNMQIGDRIIEGHIEEKVKAQQVYQKAREAGKRASLLSQQRPNIFTVALTNIAPGEGIRVAIEYQQRIRYVDRRFELRLPLVIGPRYIPGTPLPAKVTSGFTRAGWSTDTDQVPDASQITPPVVDPRDGEINPLSLRVKLDAGVPLREIVSHYHQMLERQDEEGIVHLRLAEGEVSSDRDFLLSWRPQPGAEPRAALFTDQWQDEDYALLMLLPPDQDQLDVDLPRDVIFVIDHSGSMHGPSMDQAKAALKLSVKRLKPTDRFNLIGFNNHYRALFSAPRLADSANLNRAMHFIDRLQAEGGTEMLPALERAFAYPGEASRLRQIVFLTDGSVGNEEALFTLIHQQLGNSRLFTVGIGSAPNSYFMQRAASFGRGSFTYIGDLSEVASRMQALFEKLEHPAMSDISLDWQGAGDIDIEPKRLPDLYLGEPLMISMRGSNLDGTLVIEGEREGDPWHQQVVISSKGESKGVHALWARQRIAALMTAPVDEEGGETRRKAVLDLALKHQLVSRYTSLIAVEKEPVRPPDEPLRGGMMPVNLPHGWQAQSVFGKLPQTATRGPFVLLLGALLMLASLLLHRGTLTRRSNGLFK
ncbi:MAG: marine proteobacterial sortase target protein [Candidatus Thiodiazotropha sp. (ex Lucinoma borealis)]|nr:marine proteobacterial sortase target protein [Candidatus Thiodiazotropha sp. (ex Lucinoma borealis)]